MDKSDLKNILKGLESIRIGIVGDFCIDAYWFVDESKSEISVETGKKTIIVRKQKYSLGGAGNVANNLKAMGVMEVCAFGVIGSDPYGPEMIRLMQNSGINTDNLLLQQSKWSTHVYTKPYIKEEEQSRIDFGNFNILSEITADLLIDKLNSQINYLDLVLINQQVLSGIHTPYFRKRLTELIGLFPGKKFIADSRDYIDEYAGSYRKMNDYEAALLSGHKKDPLDIIPYNEVLGFIKTLFERFKKPVFITRGECGSMAIDESGIIEIPGLMIISSIDTVGAGDSYLAGVASALAAGYGIKDAAELGTFVAGVTVQKLHQTGTASPQEIIKIGTDPDYVYRPDLAENISSARYHDSSEIELITVLPENLKIRHAIFDHDGTISTLREGWEQIMSPMMIMAIIGDNYQNTDEKIYQRVQSRVKEFIDKTTGIQTLLQMKGLVELVREFGLVPQEKVLDEFGYKEIYNKTLLQMVSERENKFKKGELSIEDFTIKNVISFLEKLQKSGIKLYLASGTDEEDVKNEAFVLGYAHLFNGGIYGAVGDVNKEAKKIVLDRILDSIGQSEQREIATFGDGPVEMRETHKRGGIAVGLASNELRRYGLDIKKRTRLIKAGADIIIPDFSQYSKLLRILQINSI